MANKKYHHRPYQKNKAIIAAARRRASGAASGNTGRASAANSNAGRTTQRGGARSASSTHYRNSHNSRSARAFPTHMRVLVLVLLLVSALITATQRVDIPVVSEVEDWLGVYDDGKTSVVETAVQGETQIHFIDVGQGDATLIAQSGKYALIDAGLASATDDILAYLHSLNIETIDVLVMTHPHADHIGAMDEIIEEFEIEIVVMPDFSMITEMPTTASFERVLTALEGSDALVETAVVGASYAVGEGTLTILSTGVETDNLNDISVCTMFTAGAFSVLNTGDAETPQEEALLASGVALNATVFQAGHHGSSTSNTLAFLQAVQPELVVISCGLDNSYGHPHAQVLDTYDAVGAAYYRTDLDGNVVITYTDADGITVHCEKDAETAEP